MAKNKVEETPKEISVEEKLVALYQLQIVSSEIDRIRILRGELPVEVKELEDELEGKHTRVSKFEAEKVRIAEQAKENESKIRIAKASIEKYNDQLNGIRNNREYDLLSKEIEFQNLEVEGFEKNIRLGKERDAFIDEELSALNADIESRGKDLEQKKGELDAIIAETRQKEEELLMKARKLEEKIDERLLKAFKRTRNNSHNGLSVVSIDREACMGCFNKIPPQRILDVKAHKKIIACEYCGRILVDPDLAEESSKAME